MQPFHRLPSDLEGHGEGFKGGRAIAHSPYVRCEVADAEGEGVTVPTPLTSADLHRLETENGITPATVEAFKLCRVDTYEGQESMGQSGNEDYSGIKFHGFWAGDQSPRVRTLGRDNPPLEQNSDGVLKPKRKYLAEPGRGNKLSFGPGEIPEVLADTQLPIVITEGPKKLCVLWQLARHNSDTPQFLACALSGVWNWKGTISKAVNSNGKRVDVKGVLPDFDRITWAGRAVVVVFDSDAATNEDVARARRRLVAELRRRGARVGVVDLPALEGMEKTGIDDFLARRGPEETLDLIHKAIEAAQSAEPTPSGVFAPVSLAQLLDEQEPLEPEWTLEDILAAGILAAIVSKPKVGKTTLVYELAVAVAHGRVFLGRATKRGNVLILAVEEHRRDVKRRLRNLGADQLDAIHVHAGPLDDSPDTFHALASFIKQYNITLVIFDTLNAFWSVSDENNAGEVTRAIKPLLQLARNTGATIFLIHHSRKAEGDYGDEIRGSGALFSLLDTALILKRHSVDIQRRLTIISRYPESPPELLLELREHGYVSLGDPAKNDKAAKLTKLADALTDSPVKVEDLAVKAGVAVKPTYALLELLTEQGKAVRGGTGKRGDPFLYSRFVSLATPKTGGPEATNSAPTVQNEPHPLNGKCVASGVQPLEGETKRNETKEGLPGPDSFLPTPVPPGSNETESGEEVVDL